MFQCKTECSRVLKCCDPRRAILPQFPENIARKGEARKPASWDEAGSGAAPSPLLWNGPFGQGQRAGQVPAGLLANVHASGRGRLEHRSHSRLLADIARSAVESPQSPNGDARSFPVALRGDPYIENNPYRREAHRCQTRCSQMIGYLSNVPRPFSGICDPALSRAPVLTLKIAQQLVNHNVRSTLCAAMTLTCK